MGLADEIIGTWRLTSRTDRLPTGEPRDEPTLGPDPYGLLVYDRAGNFAAQFMRRDRSAEPTQPIVAEVPAAAAPAATPAAPAVPARNNSTAIGGYDAYFGTYTVDDAADLVTQRLVGALNPGDVGSVVTRGMRVIDDELVIRIEMTAADGVPVVRTLRWSREA